MGPVFERRFLNFPVRIERGPNGDGKVTVVVPLFGEKTHPVPAADVAWIVSVLRQLWPEHFAPTPARPPPR